MYVQNADWMGRLNRLTLGDEKAHAEGSQEGRNTEAEAGAV